jgi:hypothetical protein
MTTPFPLSAGSRVTATFLNEIQPLIAIKTSDQDIASSTTLTADTALFAAVLADTNYLFDCFLNYEGGTEGSSDIKWNWLVPASAKLRYQAFNVSTSGNVGGGPVNTDSTVVVAGTNGAGVLMGVRMTGTLFVSSTAGNIQLQWAQNTSDSTPTIVHAQSYLRLTAG